MNCRIFLNTLCVIIIISVYVFLSIIIFDGEMMYYRANNGRRKVIVDTDAGVDDAIAIFLALASKKVDIIAITCSYGNTEEKNVEINVLKILTIANRPDIPVYGGATRPIVREQAMDGYFGKDGFGDFYFDEKITATVDRSKHASLAMIELSKKYSGDLDIITLGPLTNVALASLLDAEFTQRIRMFYTMGGQVYDPLGERVAEFNFGMDPESDVVFLSSPMNNKVVLLPFDTVSRNKIQKDWRENVLGKLNSTMIKFLNKAENFSLVNDDSWETSDAVAMAIMLWPELITSSLQAYASIVTCGPLSGVMDVNAVPPEGKEQNVEIIRDLKIEVFKKLLLKYLG